MGKTSPFVPTPGYTYLKPSEAQIREYHSLKGRPEAQKAYLESMEKFLGWEAERARQLEEWKADIQTQYPSRRYDVTFTGEEAQIRQKTVSEIMATLPQIQQQVISIGIQRASEAEFRHKLEKGYRSLHPLERQTLDRALSSFGVGIQLEGKGEGATFREIAPPSVTSTSIPVSSYPRTLRPYSDFILPEKLKTQKPVYPTLTPYSDFILPAHLRDETHPRYTTDYEQWQEIFRVKSASELQGADVPAYEALRRTVFEQPGLAGQIIQATPFIQLFGMVGVGIVKEVESTVGMIEAFVGQPSGRSYIRTLGGSLVGEGISVVTGQPVGQKIDAYGKSLNVSQPGGEVVGELVGMYLSGKVIAFIGGRTLGWAGRNIAAPLGRRVPSVIKTPVLKAAEKVSTFTSQHITQPVLSRLSKIPVVGKKLVKGHIMVVDDAGELVWAYGDDVGRYASSRLTQIKTKVVPSSYDYALWLDDFLQHYQPTHFHAMGAQTGATSFGTGGKFPMRVPATIDVTRPVAPYLSATLGGSRTIQSFAYGQPGVSSLTKVVGWKAKQTGYVASQTLGYSLSTPLPGAKIAARHFIVTEFLGKISPSLKADLLAKLGSKIMGGLPISQQLSRVGIRLVGRDMIGTSIVGASTSSFIRPVISLAIPTAITPIIRGFSSDIPEIGTMPIQIPRVRSKQREAIQEIPHLQSQPKIVPKPTLRPEIPSSTRIEIPTRVWDFTITTPIITETPIEFPIPTPQRVPIVPRFDTPIPVTPSLPPTFTFPLPSGGLELPRRGGLGFGKWHKRKHKIKSASDLFSDFMGGKRKK